ncbi:MAG TPA: hypothetical protein VNW71_23870 [Thermoanaerobaculia bacterium]|nr:hypothetical protein [Thermoanaerobaculia bacterium]
MRAIWMIRMGCVSALPMGAHVGENVARVRIVNVGTMRIEDGLIREIFIQVNPDKLP